MLLFIVRDRRTGRRYKVFQYISCYCLSNLLQIPCIIFFISIHLMLLFIRVNGLKIIQDRWISIHLMLLFISERGSNENANRYFNTSHVTVYLYPAIPGNFVIQISIHLMLLFIRTSEQQQDTERISIHLMLLFIHMPRRAWRYFPAFQYISCYCLSFS